MRELDGDRAEAEAQERAARGRREAAAAEQQALEAERRRGEAEDLRSRADEVDPDRQDGERPGSQVGTSQVATEEGPEVYIGVGVIVVILIIAQHWAGGGTVHARYAFPAMFILVVAIALPLVRYTTPWPGVAIMLVLLVWSRRETDVANKYFAVKQIGPPNSALTLPIGPEWWRLMGIGAMGVGLVVITVCLGFVKPVPAHASVPLAAAGDDGEPTDEASDEEPVLVD